ncbi:putative membrane protein [Rhodococcus wratislaviensis IFP 2016]|nr:putative membrane protein [Rhodococcus wratislaviensis IFP 2016]
MVVVFAGALLTANAFVATNFSAAVDFVPAVFAGDFPAAAFFAGAFFADVFFAGSVLA